jgi:hypothetical protein
MEIIVSIAGALLKGIFSLIGVSMDNSAKSEAEASKKALEEVIETSDAERDIMDHVLEVEHEGIKPEDIFAPELPSVDSPSL